MRLAATLTLVFIAATAGCSGSPSPQAPPKAAPPTQAKRAPSPQSPAATQSQAVTYHLADYLAVAEVQSELRDLSFDNLDQQELFTSGWTSFRFTPEGDGFRWTDGPIATLDVPRLSAEDITLHLEVEPPPQTRTRPTQSLVLHFNGHEVGVFALEWKRQTLNVNIPAALQHIGPNTLTVSPRYWVDSVLEPTANPRLHQSIYLTEGFEGDQWDAAQLTNEAPKRGQSALRLIADGSRSLKVTSRSKLRLNPQTAAGLYASVWSRTQAITQGFITTRIYFYKDGEPRRVGEKMIMAITKPEDGWTHHDLMLPAASIPDGADYAEFSFMMETDEAAPKGQVDFDEAMLVRHARTPDHLYTRGHSTGFGARISRVSVTAPSTQPFNAPRARIEGDVISQRAGTLISTYFDMPQGARLEGSLSLDPQFKGLPPGALGEVTITAHDQAGQATGLFRAGFDTLSPQDPQAVSVDLSAYGGQLAGLTLAVSVKMGQGGEPCTGCTVHWEGMSIEGQTQALSPGPAPKRRPYNVLMILDDTLRADQLGALGGPVKTPHIDALAQGGVAFVGARAESSFTPTSVTSLLTATAPTTHRLLGREKLPKELPYLPQLLKEAGYATLGVSMNSNIAHKTLFNRGFDRFYDAFRPKWGKKLTPAKLSPQARADAVWDLMLEPFFDKKGDAPFFAYLHDIDPHSPYRPPPPYDTAYGFGYQGALSSHDSVFPLIHGGQMKLGPGEARYLKSLYQGEIAYMDAFFGALMTRLKGEGLLKDTLIVFVSDHGEEFMEHGRIGHNKGLYEEVVQVPLILHLPGVLPEGKRPQSPVGLMDIPPTLLDLMGVDAPEGLEGQSLLPLLSAPDTYQARRPQLAQMQSRFDAWSSARLGPWKLHTQTLGYGIPTEARLLFNLDDDPTETVNLAPAYPIVTRALAQHLRWQTLQGALKAHGPEALKDADLDDETRAHLKELGYLD